MVLLNVLAKAFLFLDLFKVSESLDEVLSQGLNMRILLLKLIDADSIWNCLDQASCWTSGDDVEWPEPELKTVRLKNCLELLDELRGELLLSKVIW